MDDLYRIDVSIWGGGGTVIIVILMGKRCFGQKKGGMKSLAMVMKPGCKILAYIMQKVLSQ
jgi:hypothetical protein